MKAAIVRADPRAARGLLVPLGGVVTDPDGMNFGVAKIEGDQVTLRYWRSKQSETGTVQLTRGVAVRIDDREVLVSAVLTEEGKRPWVVLGPA